MFLRVHGMSPEEKRSKEPKSPQFYCTDQ